jgi:uncharacterized protein HemX
VSEEQQLENNEQVQSKPVAEVAKKSKAFPVFGIINLVVSVGLAAGGYFLLQNIETQQTSQGSNIDKNDLREIESSKQLNAFQSQLAAMQSQIATFNQELTGKDNHFTDTLANFSQLHTAEQNATKKELIAEITHVKRQLGKTRGDWLIADAEYLLSVASQRLHLAGDINTAMMALEAADQRLRESGDTAAFDVREQVAKEVAALRAVPPLDIVGTYSAIQSLKDNISELAVLLPYAGKPLTESKQVHLHETEQQADHGVLNSALHLFEGYITVKHTDKPVTHILTEQEVGFILQQLSVKLEMIKISLVQQNDLIYKSSIADARQWLKSNFTPNTRYTHFLEKLDLLEKIQLHSKLPDISLSLKMIKGITKLRGESDKGQQPSSIEAADAQDETVNNPSEATIETLSLKEEEPILVQPEVNTPLPPAQPIQTPSKNTEVILDETVTP